MMITKEYYKIAYNFLEKLKFESVSLAKFG